MLEVTAYIIIGFMLGVSLKNLKSPKNKTGQQTIINKRDAEKAFRKLLNEHKDITSIDITINTN